MLCFYLASLEQLFKLKDSFKYKFDAAIRLPVQTGQKKLEPAAKRTAMPNSALYMTLSLQCGSAEPSIFKKPEREGSKGSTRKNFYNGSSTLASSLSGP